MPETVASEDEDAENVVEVIRSLEGLVSTVWMDQEEPFQ